MDESVVDGGGTRARRRDANLVRILDAAARLVADEGLDALSMARVADAVDYTAGALYRYVESKDALLSLLVQRILDELRGELAAAVEARADASPLARVAAMIAAYRGFVARAPHRFGVLAIALATPRVLLAAPGHAAPATAAVIATLRPIADALSSAVDARELAAGDAIERTLTLFATLHGLAQLPKLAHHAPGAFDVERLVRGAVRALLIGWGGEAAHVEAALASPGLRATEAAVDAAQGTRARRSPPRRPRMTRRPS
jgi:AcrR family transcriptional regulator